MNHRMTIHATTALRIGDGIFAQRANGGGLARDLWHLRAMRRMTFIAQEWWPSFQHKLRCAAMRVVAISTIFIDRFMWPDEGAAFLCVAGVAGFNCAIPLYQFGPDRSMHIVAIRTTDLAFKNSVARGPLILSTLFLVAGKTDFGLGSLVTYFVLCRMNLMT